MSEPAWLTIARSYIGLAEIPGKETNPTIRNWLRLGERVLRCPLRAMNALTYTAPRDAELALGHIKREFSTEGREAKRIPFVVVLLVSLYPAAIFASVVGVVVYTIKLMARRRTDTHVSDKAFESVFGSIAVQPSVADIDSSAPVIFVSPSRWIQASPFHVCPYPLRGRVGETVLCYFRALQATFQGVLTRTAHRCLSGSKVERQCLAFCAAIAACEVVAAALADDCPISESDVCFHGV